MKNNQNLRVRRVVVEVKGQNIEYDEKYVVNDLGEEIFNRDIEIENDQQLYNLYKRRNNLLTSNDIKKIRQKYHLTQKDYALVIGVGEITVHRFEKGSIQSEAVDFIMRLSDNPDNMAFLLFQNQNNIPSELFVSLTTRIQELQTLKKHMLVNLTNIDFKNLPYQPSSAHIIAMNIINSYNTRIDKSAKVYGITPEYITPLKLQKLLYYVQGICVHLYNAPAFNEKIIAWNYGPVVEEVYQEYKNNHHNGIKTPNDIIELKSSLKRIVEEVIDTYGKIDANELIDFTHEEDPWKLTKQNEEITIDKIKDYFNRVYNN